MMMMMRGAHPVPTGERAIEKYVFFLFFFLISPFGIWGKKNVSSRSILCMDIYLPCTGLG